MGHLRGHNRRILAVATVIAIRQTIMVLLYLFFSKDDVLTQHLESGLVRDASVRRFGFGVKDD